MSATAELPTIAELARMADGLKRKRDALADPRDVAGLSENERVKLDEERRVLRDGANNLRRYVDRIRGLQAKIAGHEQWRATLQEVRAQLADELEELTVPRGLRDGQQQRNKRLDLQQSIDSIDHGWQFPVEGCCALFERLQAAGVEKLPGQPTMLHGRRQRANTEKIMAELQQQLDAVWTRAAREAA